MKAKLKNKKNGKPSNVTSLPTDPQQQARIDSEYINGLLAGKTQPPNEFVGDLLQQMRQANAETGQLRTAIERAENDLKAMRDRRLVLDGIVQHLGQTVIVWRGKKAAPASKAPVAPPPPPPQATPEPEVVPAPEAQN